MRIELRLIDPIKAIKQEGEKRKKGCNVLVSITVIHRYPIKMRDFSENLPFLIPATVCDDLLSKLTFIEK